jgi:hypothetical protein
MLLCRHLGFISTEEAPKEYMELGPSLEAANYAAT